MSDKSTSQGIIGGYATGGGGGASTVNEIQAFPAALINWVQDSSVTPELWDKVDAPLAFRVDFITSGYTKLKWFKSIFSGNNGHPSGKFAIWGNGSTKIAEETLPDYSSYGRVDFASIDISSYEYLSVAMDPGLSGIPQPLMQSILVFPEATALSRSAFAGTFVHTHNTTFPSTCPSMIASDLKYFLARWCALGVA